MKWVSIEERMPPQPEHTWQCVSYLVALESGVVEKVNFAHTTSGFHEFIWNEDICTPITHWMPLPDPPSQKGTKDMVNVIHMREKSRIKENLQ